MTWTQTDIEKLGLKTKSTPTGKIVLPKKQAKGLTYIINTLVAAKIEFVQEYKFLPDRKFRFDIAVMAGNLKFACEFDGVISAKSRHTTVTGFTRDCEKMNLAAINGWIVLRYTALNYKEFYNDLQKLIK